MTAKPDEYPTNDLAPCVCIVCGKLPPGPNSPGWSLLVGFLPLGSMTCSDDCLVVALGRFKSTGRLDLQVKS